MYKIIGGDGQEYGPVDIEQLRQWIAEGRLDGRTMVQLEGATDWQPAMAVTELAALLSSAGATSPPPATETPLPTTESILARDYQVQTGSWISAGWELVKSRFWMLVGATLVILLIQIAAESVPLIGGLVGLVVTGPLYGGLYWLNLRLVRGEPAEFSDAFAGFNRAFVQLMLVNIIISLIIMAILVPGAVGVLGGLALMGVFGELADIVPNLSLPPLLTPLGYVFFAIGCLMAVAGVLATIYLTVCWWFGIPLVVDRLDRALRQVNRRHRDLLIWPRLSIRQRSG